MAKKKTLVLFPSLGVGHLNPMVELAKALLRHGLDILIAVVDAPDTDAVSSAAVARLAAANPAIAFRLLPTPASSPADLGAAHAHPVKRGLATLRRANPALRDLLLRSTVDALVLDMFCVDALDVAAELGVPAYFFFTSPASDLAVYLALPSYYPTAPPFHESTGRTSLVSCVPGMPPLRAMDMPQTFRGEDRDAIDVRLYQFRRMAEGSGILVNTYDWLEPWALSALVHDAVCGVPGGRPPPRVYCIGPLVNAGGGAESGGGESRHECLAWLDTQPRRSVVFLCFGSQGAFSATQLREIARGLERAGHRFLWAVRSPPEEQTQSRFPEREPDLERLLPAGFLERTRSRGMVVRSWAPQAEVLRHEAVAAFVTHGGWNSALEAVVAGVPMICWPLYNEQRMNKVFMVEEMKVAVEMEGYEEEVVKAEEVEAKVRMVMDSDEGKVLRERLVVAKEKALEAISEGGSSEAAFAEFLRDMEVENAIAHG